MAHYTEAELTKKSLAELRELADEHDLEFDDEKPKKAQLIEALLDIEDDEEADDDELDELDDEVDDLELPEDDEEDELDDEEPASKKTRAKKPAKATKSADGEPTLAAKQVATMLGTEAKVLRQFFRSPASTVEAVGSGGRYEFLETDVPKIKEEFEAWRGAHAARGTKRGTGKKSSTQVVEEIEEVESIEELEIDELDDEIDDEDLELED